MNYRQLLLLLVCVSLVESLNCDAGQQYLKITRKTMTAAADELFTIFIGATSVLDSEVYANSDTKTTEHCITGSTNSQYTIRLTDAKGDYWTSLSWIQILGVHGNTVLKTYCRGPSESTAPLSLYTPVALASAWKFVNEATGTWTTYGYTPTGWADITTGDTASVVTLGTQYFRKTFAGLPNMAAYEVNLEYTDGIIVHINGAEKYRDNLDEGPVTKDTSATASYSTMAFRGFIRNGYDVKDTTSVIAVEIHLLTTTANVITFNAFLAIYAASFTQTGAPNCYHVTSPFTVTGTGTNPVNALDFGWGSYWYLSPTNNMYLTVTYSDVKPALNGITLYPATNNIYAPRDFALLGSNTAGAPTDQYSMIGQVMGIAHVANTMVTVRYDPAVGIYKFYRFLNIASAVANSYVNDVFLNVCYAAPVTSFSYATTTVNIKIDAISVNPSVYGVSNCSCSTLPPGITINAVSCVISGIASSGTTQLHTITSTIPFVITGTLQLNIQVCAYPIIEVSRVYGTSSATYETHTIKTYPALAVIQDVQAGQVAATTVKNRFCVSSDRIQVSTESTNYQYWYTLSYIYINSVLTTTQVEPVLKTRYDAMLGVRNDVVVGIRQQILPSSTWSYKMGYSNTDWFTTSATGWSVAAEGSFPDSTDRFQVYRKTYTADTSYAGGISVNIRYRHGCIIVLNGNEVYRNNVAEGALASLTATTSYPALQYRNIGFPLKASAATYVANGATNTIAVALIAPTDATVLSEFDLSVRLYGHYETSQIFNPTLTYGGVTAGANYGINKYYSQSVYYTSCTLASFYQLVFADDTRAWVSSIEITNYYLNLQDDLRQFTFSAKNAIDTTWTLLTTQTGWRWWTKVQKKKLFIGNFKPYNQYRFDNFGTGDSPRCTWRFNQIELFSDKNDGTFPALSYSPASVEVYKDVEIVEIFPDDFTFYSSFTVSPALPSGLLLDPPNGVIVGTPTTTQAATPYTITAMKPDGTTANTVLQLSITICYGGKTLVSNVMRIDTAPTTVAYELTNLSTGANVSSRLGFPTASSSYYIDHCLEDGLYTFRFFRASASGWIWPGAWTVAVDQLTDIRSGNKLDFGWVSTSATTISETFTTISSVTAFQMAFTTWKVFTLSQDVPAAWADITFDDSGWQSLLAANIGFPTQITAYVRTTFDIPNHDIYSLLNVHMLFSGGVVAYFDGKRVARFNIPSTFNSTTYALGAHSSTTVSRFPVLLHLFDAVEGKNVMCFELHRSEEQVPENFVFDATGVYGVNTCNVLAITFMDIQASFTPTSGAFADLFDLTPDTIMYYGNVAGNNFNFTTENLESVRFNTYSLGVGQAQTGFSWVLSGRLATDLLATVMDSQVGYATIQRAKNTFKTFIGMSGFNTYQFLLTNIGSGVMQIGEFSFMYCTTSGIPCKTSGEYPGVGHSDRSPSPCGYGKDGYKYKVCTNGQFELEQTENCVERLPENLMYISEVYYVVMNSEVTIPAPRYDYIIHTFTLAPETPLPQGLFLDSKNGEIFGSPFDITTEPVIVKVYGENLVGKIYTTVGISVREGMCLAIDNYKGARIGETVSYSCSNESGVGTKKRKCIMGPEDGEWGKENGSCFPMWALILIIVVVVLVIVAVVALVLMPRKSAKLPKKPATKN